MGPIDRFKNPADMKYHNLASNINMGNPDVTQSKRGAAPEDNPFKDAEYSTEKRLNHNISDIFCQGIPEARRKPLRVQSANKMKSTPHKPTINQNQLSSENPIIEDMKRPSLACIGRPSGGKMSVKEIKEMLLNDTRTNDPIFSANFRKFKKSGITST